MGCDLSCCAAEVRSGGGGVSGPRAWNGNQELFSWNLGLSLLSYIRVYLKVRLDGVHVAKVTGSKPGSHLRGWVRVGIGNVRMGFR